MKKVNANGREFRVTGNPDMGTVRYVQEMEIEMMRQYIDDDVLMEMEDGTGQDAASNVLEGADVDDLKSLMWERSAQQPLQTICLATNEKLTIDDIEEMKSLQYLELKQASEDALGGTAEDFIDKLGIGISSQVKEIQEQMNEGGSNGLEDETPPSVSNLSNTQETG